MPKRASKDPAVGLNCTIKKSILNRIETARGPVKRSTWVEMACEERLNNESALSKLVAAGKLTPKQAGALLKREELANKGMP